MAASTQDVLGGIERRRAQLQADVDKLRKLLTHWTTWEAEYATLKADIQRAKDPPLTQMRDIARNLAGFLLNEREFEELLGKDSQSKRSANQVIDIISRRIDYVQQNSACIEKQLDAAEKQLAGVDVLLEPGLDNEEGLPMMDIEERLDDAGNEISSSINQTGKGTTEVVEALRKAGLQRTGMEKQESLQESFASTPMSTSEIPANHQTSQLAHTLPRPVPPPSSTPKKSASFAESDSKTKPSNAKEVLLQDGYDEDLETLNFHRGTKVIQLDENNDMVASYPIIPQGETPEDAELRRQMLQYGLSEVGRVVAELDLDRPTASYSDDDVDENSDFNDYDTEEDEDEDEDEDEYGRTKKSVVSEEYRRQMIELEAKLDARMLENVGPEPDLGARQLTEYISDVRTMHVREDDDSNQSLDPANPIGLHEAPNEMLKKKKGVRFAENLDISDAPSMTLRPTAIGQHATRANSTLSNTIVERAGSIVGALNQPSQPAKISRFKSARTRKGQPPQIPPIPVVQVPPVPTGPAGRTLARAITEHITASDEPQVPDEFDPILIRREVQADYHKARNKLIQKQGGFTAMAEEESEEEGFVGERRDGQGKRVSRFMAARLKADSGR